MELNIIQWWLLGGAGFILLEVLGAPGVGFLFAGLAAFVVAVLLYAGVTLPASYQAQFTWFFCFTVLWAAVLWRPMQRFLLSHKHAPGYADMQGQTATILDNDLTLGKDGVALWSGTRMSARLHPNAGVERIAAGATVRIAEVSGATLLVKPA